MNVSVKSLSAEMIFMSRLVEKEVQGHDSKTIAAWGKANARRHAFILIEILKLISNRPESCSEKPLRILNAGGIGNGSQDFCLVDALKNRGITNDWTVMDLANNPLLNNDFFAGKLKELSITLSHVDYTQELDLVRNDVPAGSWDVVLFTEIAEHLDYSAFLKALKFCKDSLAPGGILIITTPNLLYLRNRIMFFCGVADGPSLFFKDRIEDIDTYFGHIIYYDPKRLSRILNSLGLSVLTVKTFCYGHGPLSRLKRWIASLINAVSSVFSYGGQNIIITARNNVDIHARLDD